MADINDYLPDYYKLTEPEKALMDIFAECWEYCRSRSCENCEYRQGGEKIKMLACISYQYAKRLIAAGVVPVRHGRWIEHRNPYTGRYFTCSECGKDENRHTAITGRYCWSCGAKMDLEDEHHD